MISDITETLAILKEKGFNSQNALQIMIIEELKNIGEKLDELGRKE